MYTLACKKKYFLNYFFLCYNPLLIIYTPLKEAGSNLPLYFCLYFHTTLFFKFLHFLLAFFLTILYTLACKKKYFLNYFFLCYNPLLIIYTPLKEAGSNLPLYFCFYFYAILFSNFYIFCLLFFSLYSILLLVKRNTFLTISFYVITPY